MIIRGQTAIVTGGSRGIGAAIAEGLAEKGANIAVIYAGNEKAAEAVCEKCRTEYGVAAKSYRCDVSDFEAAKQTAAQIKSDFGAVGILVNNAGITRDGLIAAMKESDFDAVIGTNLKGAFNMIRHCSGTFIKNRCGRIINISSAAGLVGNAGQSNYSASKAGIVGLTKSAARELAPRNILCNAVAPGFIDTDMTRGLALEEEKLASTVPLGRFGSVKDVADAVVFLAASDYITGEVIRVDGGAAM